MTPRAAMKYSDIPNGKRPPSDAMMDVIEFPDRFTMRLGTAEEMDARGLGHLETLKAAVAMFDDVHNDPAAGQYYCNGTVYLPATRYRWSGGWLKPGRLKLYGVPGWDGACTRIDYEGTENEDGYLIAVANANAKSGNSNFCEQIHGLNLRCYEKIQGARLSLAQMSQVSNLYVKDPIDNGNGIRVCEGSNHFSIHGQVWAGGKAGESRPGSGVTGVLCDSYVHGRFDLKVEQCTTGFYFNNGNYNLDGSIVEACGEAIVTDEKKNSITGDIHVHANQSEVLVRCKKGARMIRLSGVIRDTPGECFLMDGDEKVLLTKDGKFSPFRVELPL